MREGLAREFPGALRAAAWARARVGRRLVLWGEPVVWATISGIGAGFLVASLWPQFLGIGLGIVLARTSLMTRGGGTNSLLRVSGGLALALFVVNAAWGIAVAQSGYAAETAGGSTSALTIAAGIVAAAVAAGVLAAQLPRGVRNAAIVAAVWLVPWFALEVPFASRSLTESMAAEQG